MVAHLSNGGTSTYQSKVCLTRMCLAECSQRVLHGIISMWRKLPVGVPKVTETKRIVSEISRRFICWSPVLLNKDRPICIAKSTLL